VIDNVVLATLNVTGFDKTRIRCTRNIYNHHVVVSQCLNLCKQHLHYLVAITVGQYIQKFLIPKFTLFGQLFV